MIVIFESIKKMIAQNARTVSCSREQMYQNLKKYHLVMERNIVGIVVICANMLKV